MFRIDAHWARSPRLTMLIGLLGLLAGAACENAGGGPAPGPSAVVVTTVYLREGPHTLQVLAWDQAAAPPCTPPQEITAYTRVAVPGVLGREGDEWRFSSSADGFSLTFRFRIIPSPFGQGTVEGQLAGAAVNRGAAPFDRHLRVEVRGAMSGLPATYAGRLNPGTTSGQATGTIVFTGPDGEIVATCGMAHVMLLPS